MRRSIYIFFILICAMTISAAKQFKILDIKKSSVDNAKWTKDGKTWKILKRGDTFKDSLIGFSIPKGVSVIISYQKSKNTYTGPRNILLSHIKDDMSKSDNADNVFASVLNGVKDVIFSQSQVTEGSSRGAGDDKEQDVTLLFYNGLPNIISESSIRKVGFYQCYATVHDLATSEELIVETVSSNQYSFEGLDFSDFYKQDSSVEEDIFSLQVLLDNGKLYRYTVKFISNAEYTVYKTYGANFETLTENLYTSQEYINEAKLKGFIGGVQIKL